MDVITLETLAAELRAPGESAADALARVMAGAAWVRASIYLGPSDYFMLASDAAKVRILK
jgi:hypothetical protein